MSTSFSHDKSLRQIQNLKQEQKLSPRQILQIRITQVPRLELEQMIYQELESNPLLEIVENEQEISNSEIVEDQLQKELSKFFEDDFPTFFSPSELTDPPERQIPYSSTLSEHLKSELRLEISNPDEIEIGEYIIDSLNNEGFLDIPVESIANLFGVEKEIVEKVRKLIQSFDPPGIAAKNARESIQIQMERNPKKWKLELDIVNNHWDFYKNADINGLSRQINIDSSTIKKAFENIRNINPNPSTIGDFGEIRYVTPNVVVSKKGKTFDVAINEPNLPYLRLNTKYLRILQHPKDFDKGTIEFVKDYMDRAIFVLRCFEMRRKNFKKVMNFIVDKQKEFLDKGVLFMNPLRLTDIAEATNLSESTISRYIKDTYIQTPKGVFHLKHFLSGGLESKEGIISTNAIREKIKRIIEKEGKDTLTDEEIANNLINEGIDISRRTVAKYRNQMEIPSSRERKREKEFYE